MEIERQDQLAVLRRRIARIDRKYANTGRRTRPARPNIEQLLPGEIVRTRFGEHFETEKVWEPHRRYGSVGIGELAELPVDFLYALSEGAIPRSHPRRWAFLDTETTGLGAGSYAFLVGVGSVGTEGFRLRQFFLRAEDEEHSLLSRLAEYLAQFEVLITYNGKAYDQPLLESRFRGARLPHPFSGLAHLDLLFGARRLWKLRLESCRLVELENQILGVERQGDLPGVMIPYCYFEYQRTQEAFQLIPIFHHNAMDILSLACLTAVVPLAFRAPEEASLRHGTDLIGLARWMLKCGQREEAARLLRRAVSLGLPDHLLFRALWDTAAIYKRLGQFDAARDGFAELVNSRNPYRARAYEELAKHFERRERDYVQALRMTQNALALDGTAALRRREQRLSARVAKAAAAMRS